MSLRITDDCISCGACESECPVGAIFDGPDHTEIDPAKCVECKGHYDEPQCQGTCPSDAIVR
jgi:ferredoxin